MHTLHHYGWHPFFEAAFAEFADTYQPARILAEYQGLYRVMTQAGETLAKPSGRFWHQRLSREEHPAVGDWVALHWQPAMDQGRIEAVLPRRSAFIRRQGHQAQVVAANVDILLLVSSLNQDLNLRRIERYLALAWESGARPVIVLNKADLAHDLAAARQAVEQIGLGTEVYAVSALSGQGLADLQALLAPGQTLALLGSSGVGKSTLVNALGAPRQQVTQAIREDDAKGRHTTTHRELFCLPSGGLLIDTPGMRELQLWHAEEGLDTSFAEIEELASRCRFRNCQHRQEAGCAIQQAIGQGELDAGRLQNYLKLQREEAWVARKADPALQANAKRRWKKVTQSHRQRDLAQE